MLEFYYHRGSHNISYYGEAAPERKGRIWVQCLRDGIDFKTNPPSIRKTPRFYCTIYCTGKGEVGRFRYSPRLDPEGGYPAPELIRQRTIKTLKERTQ